MSKRQEWMSDLREQWINNLKEKGLTPENCFLNVKIRHMETTGVQFSDPDEKYGPLTNVDHVTIEGVIDGEKIVMDAGIHRTRVHPEYQDAEDVLFKYKNQPFLNPSMIQEITVGENSVSGPEAVKLVRELMQLVHPYINYRAENYLAFQLWSERRDHWNVLGEDGTEEEQKKELEELYKARRKYMKKYKGEEI